MKILVVDDDVVIREFIGEYLMEEGYQVIEADDGRHAVEALQGDREIFILLTDICMPGIDGLQLARSCQDMRPDVQIILMSGYTAQLNPVELNSLSHTLLRKPFNFAVIVDEIKRTLSRGA